MNFNIQVPINSVSFGQVSLSLLKEFYKLGMQPCIFPIGPIECNGIPLAQDFVNWLNSCISKSLVMHSRDVPMFKLWHIHDSFATLSRKQLLYTFYELDSPTPAELNVVKNIDKVTFSSKYAASVYSDSGADNVNSIPLGFDKESFYIDEQPKLNDDRIVFTILGKLEKRKNHKKAIRAWIKKYGNNPKYFLQCALFNPFYNDPRELEAMYNEILDGKNYFNIKFYPFLPSSKDYNSFLNSAHIVIAASGGEGWGLPEFHSVALGKHAVVLNAHSYQDWATNENSVLVNPSGKIKAYDGKFFMEGIAWNQGNIFTFDDDAMINGFELAVKRYESNPMNFDGIRLQNVFTYKKMADSIINEMKLLENNA